MDTHVPEVVAGAEPAYSDSIADPLEAVARELLVAIGEDPERDGLRDTPARFARWWREFVNFDPGVTTTTFDTQVSGQCVVVSGIRVWSMCEHHLLPFACVLNIGYLTGDRLLGLSKFARIAHQHAHRLQVQERLVTDVADDVEKATGSPDVAVVAQGEHMCMTMRGIRTSARMTSTIWRGTFSREPHLRAELLSLSGPRPLGEVDGPR